MSFPETSPSHLLANTTSRQQCPGFPVKPWDSGVFFYQKKSLGCSNTTIMAAFHSGSSPTLILPSSLHNTWLVLLLGDINGGYLSTAHSQRAVIGITSKCYQLIETSLSVMILSLRQCLDCVCLKKRNVFIHWLIYESGCSDRSASDYYRPIFSDVWLAVEDSIWNTNM